MTRIIRVEHCIECPWYQPAFEVACWHPDHSRAIDGNAVLIIDGSTEIDPDCPLPQEDTGASS